MFAGLADDKQIAVSALRLSARPAVGCTRFGGNGTSDQLLSSLRIIFASSPEEQEASCTERRPRHTELSSDKDFT